MFFSIVIPAYNSEKTINKCLDSILSQDFLDYEIIIVNDGSLDNTQKVVEEYIVENKSKRITLINTTNGGPSKARNKGIEHATGKYIWFVDSDDEIEKESLDILYEHLSIHEPDILRFSFRRIINGNSIRVNTTYKENVYENNTLDKFLYESLACGWHDGMTCWSHVYRRNFIDSIRFNENTTYGEDILFNCIAYTKAKRIEIIADVLYRYYTREGTLARSKRHILKQIVDAYTLIKDAYIKEDIWDKFKTNILCSYADFALLGGGIGKRGALYLEYSLFDENEETYNYVSNIVNSNNFKVLIKDALARELPNQLEELYKMLLNGEAYHVYEIIKDELKRNESNFDNQYNDHITFKCDFEITQLNDKIIAVPINGNEKPYFLELNKESASALKFMIETKSIKRTLTLLNDLYKEENSDEIRENLLDFISELKSQEIID